MTSPRLTDAQIRDAFERRADVDLPRDIRGDILAVVASHPQRDSWVMRAAEAVRPPASRRAILALAAVALLIATSVAIALVGSDNKLTDGSGPGLAFISDGNLWTADGDGEHPRLVLDMPGTMVVSRPTWVDRDTLLIQETSGGVYSVDLRTATSRLLAEAGALLALSEDHRRVAIGFERSDGPHLSIMEIASGRQVADVLVHPAFAAPASPQIGPQVGLTGGPHAWSPDGRWLLGQGFASSASATSGWIYRLDVQTGEISDLATNLCCGLHKPNPVLAPDGSSVVYMNFHQATQGEICNFRCGTLWSLDPVNAVRQQLTATEGSEIGPIFSPDGSWIAFAEYVGPGYDVAIVHPDGTGRRKLTNIGDVYAPPANIEPYAYLAWDPDGKGLTFMRGPDTSMEHELWHVALDGQPAQRLGTLLVSEFAR